MNCKQIGTIPNCYYTSGQFIKCILACGRTQRLRASIQDAGFLMEEGRNAGFLMGEGRTLQGGDRVMRERVE